MSINSLHKKYLTLWTLAHKFSGGNSKITKQIEDYIKENFLEDTFVYQSASGETKTLPAFILAEPRNGKRTPYFNPLAMNSFIQERGAEIKEKAADFERECPTIGLRMLRRVVNIRPSQEKNLLKFIETKCLHDTFETTDENGNPIEELIFDYPMDNHSKAYLCVRKKGIHTFIKNHKEELEAIGAKNLPALIANIPQFKRDEGFIQKTDLFQILHIPNQNRQAFNEFFDTVLCHQQKEEVDENGHITLTPLFVKRKSRQRTVYCIKKSDIAYLIQKNESALRQIGLPQAIIDHYNKIKPLEKRTSEMISFRTFGDNFLHSRRISALFHAIKSHCINDTYPTVDENNNPIQQSVFVKVRAGADETKNYVFRNKEALLYFMKQNKEFLLENGVTPIQYSNIFKEAETIVPEGEHVLVSDLSEKYHFFGREQLPQIPSFVHETFTTVNANGEKEEKPLVFAKREPSSGYLKYYILKEAILTLLTRHKKDLKVQDNTLKAILKKKPILLRTPSMITMENLATVFGKGLHCYPQFTKLVETACLNDRHINPQTNKEEDTFVYAMSQSGKICLMLEASGLESFIQKHARDLLAMGLTPQNINKALLTAKLQPDFYQQFVLNRQQKQEKARQIYHQQKER